MTDIFPGIPQPSRSAQDSFRPFRFIVEFKPSTKPGKPVFVVARTEQDPLPGETWSRGNDQGDGYFDDPETLETIIHCLREVWAGRR